MTGVQDELELRQLIGPALERAAAVPRDGDVERMVEVAVRGPRRGRQWGLVAPLVRSARFALMAFIVVAGVAVGLRLEEFAASQDNRFAPPLQVECDRPRVSDCVSFDMGTGYGMPRDDGVAGDVLRVLANLGQPYTGPRRTELADTWPLPLAIEISPNWSSVGDPLQWRAANGDSGEVERLTIDLTQLAHGTGPAFVLLNYLPGDHGTAPEWYIDEPEEAPAYAIPNELGQAILDRFDLPPQVGH